MNLLKMSPPPTNRAKNFAATTLKLDAIFLCMDVPAPDLSKRKPFLSGQLTLTSTGSCFSTSGSLQLRVASATVNPASSGCDGACEGLAVLTSGGVAHVTRMALSATWPPLTMTGGATEGAEARGTCCSFYSNDLLTAESGHRLWIPITRLQRNLVLCRDNFWLKRQIFC